MLLALHTTYLEYLIVAGALVAYVTSGALAGVWTQMALDLLDIHLPPDTGFWVGVGVSVSVLLSRVL